MRVTVQLLPHITAVSIPLGLHSHLRTAAARPWVTMALPGPGMPGAMPQLVPLSGGQPVTPRVGLASSVPLSAHQTWPLALGLKDDRRHHD